jgi:maltose O-acetyltransferase
MPLAHDRQRLAFRPWHLLVNVVAASGLVPGGARAALYRRAGLDVRSDAIRSGCLIHTARLSVGEDTLVGASCHFENREQIRVGARCSLAPEVAIATSSHAIGAHHRRAGDYDGAPVSIGDGCWIGTRATILPGVTVGAGCVIAAGAVVTDDCAPDGLYAGIPARRVRDL